MTHTVDTRYYDVEGTTPRQILDNEGKALASFLAASDVVMEKRGRGHGVAATAGKICWNGRYEQAADGSCRLEVFQVIVHIVFVLPAWTPSGSVAPATRTWWSHHAAAASTHEQGHAAITLEGAKEMYEAVLALPAAPTCDALKQSIAETMKAGHEKSEERQHRYDATMPTATE